MIDIRAPRDTAHLLHDLGRLWPSYLAYAISFLLIGLIWANHHAMFEHIRATDRLLMFLNTLLLMNVGFLPFVAAVLAAALRTGQGEDVAAVLYGAALVVGGIFFNGIWEYARRDHRLLAASLDVAAARTMSRRFLLGPVLYAIGTALGGPCPGSASRSSRC